MSFFNYEAIDVWFANDSIWVKLEDGSMAGLPVSNFPKLAKATPEQRMEFEIIDGYALYWPALDEDLSVAGFFEKNEEIQKSNQKSRPISI